MVEKPILFIIAGPQSSGKTTILKYLKKKFPYFLFINETNQYSLLNKNHLGGAFVTREIEEQIVKADIKKVEEIDRSLKHIVIETGIMHCAYLEVFMSKTDARSYFHKYIQAHKGLHPILIFIDTKPQVSWNRRRRTYIERIIQAGVIDSFKKKEMLAKYKRNIENLYPLWIKYYKKIPFEKYMIKNSNKTWEKFEREIMNKIKEYI